MKLLIFGPAVLILAATSSLAQTVRLSEDFEATPAGQLPTGWAASDPSTVSVETTSIPGFGTQAAAIQGTGPSSAGATLSSPVFSPARRGHVSFDVAIKSGTQQYDFSVIDGGGQFNSILRFNSDGSISAYRSAGTSLYFFSPTAGSWSQGVPTHLAIDYQAGAILQDGVPIGATSDLTQSLFGAVGAARLSLSVTGSSTSSAAVLIDNVSFLACEPPASFCAGAPNSVSPIAGAQMFLAGSAYLSTNDVRFTVFGMPPNAPMLLFHGDGTGSVPLGDGILCVAPGHQGLFRGAVGVSGRNDPPFVPTAQGDILVPLGAAPYDSGPSAILSGTTWNFQAAYRDSTTFGSGLNFTNALRTMFCM